MARNKKKIIRVTTHPSSLTSFCTGLLSKMNEKYDVVAISSPGPELEQIQESDGVRVIAVPMERHISLSRDLKSLLKLIKVFYKEKPYMVHSMTPKAGLLCMMAAWICRVPRRVHTFTGLVWPTASGLTRKILMTTDWITCACATHIIPEGKGVMNDLQDHITKKPMRVLGYGNVRGIDMDYWRVTPELKNTSLKNKEVFTFLFVGRIVGDKGINELVEAFIKLMVKHDNIRLILVGPFEEKLDPLKQVTIDRIKNTPGIQSVGKKQGEDLLAYYAVSDCFVIPSYREGFPNTVLEAGAMGLPQIVTDINGSREIIISNSNINSSANRVSSLRICDNGIIVPSKDANSLYEAMEMMLTDESMRKKMAGNARRMIETRFEKSFVQGCQMTFYDEIMK